MMPCTWTVECPAEGVRRMERIERRGISVVEFVCDEHVRNAEDQGYALKPSMTPP